MVNDGKLPRLQGMRQIRIPVEAFEQWVTDNTVYNPNCAGSAMRNPKGERKCISARRKKVSTLTRSAARTGSVPTQTQAARELGALLELPTSGRP